jgi:hypothetical protein
MGTVFLGVLYFFFFPFPFPFFLDFALAAAASALSRFSCDHLRYTPSHPQPRTHTYSHADPHKRGGGIPQRHSSLGDWSRKCTHGAPLLWEPAQAASAPHADTGTPNPHHRWMRRALPPISSDTVVAFFCSVR